MPLSVPNESISLKQADALMGYDVIGDVHGQYAKMVALLQSLGYRQREGAYRHPDNRQAIFVGDLIDRGPGQAEVLDAVRRMVDAGSARSIMGNHEWNAIGYHRRLHRRTDRKTHQHKAFLEQIGVDTPLSQTWIDWLSKLPPYLDLGGIRVCHAWWSQPLIDRLGAAMNADGSLPDDFLVASFDRRSDAYAALDPVTKGQEVALPGGRSFVDHEGTERREVRVRWWAESATTFRDAAMVPSSQAKQLPMDALPPGIKLGTDSPVPVFVGHYWLSGRPQVQHPRIAVLDYGAALEGPLVAYRWDGEPELDSRHLVAVGGSG